jgi:hypothetical protein
VLLGGSVMGPAAGEVIGLLVLAAGLLLGTRVFARLDTGSGLRGDAESSVAERRLDETSRTGPQLTLLLDGRGEAFALPLVILLLLLIFRGLVALTMPLLVSVSGALLILLGVSAADISTYSVNVVTMVGLVLLALPFRHAELRNSGYEALPHG